MAVAGRVDWRGGVYGCHASPRDDVGRPYDCAEPVVGEGWQWMPKLRRWVRRRACAVHLEVLDSKPSRVSQDDPKWQVR